MDHFELVSEYKPTGDQPEAIRKLVEGFREGNQCETLLGVTGSGKTFTMANVIAQLNKPTLIIAHNKTLAAQLYSEFKEFFPENAVEYFVSYYDYYQPEAYVPSSDTYIAKDSSINDEIDKLRLSATTALAERRDVIIISSVSCIYGLGSPVDYKNMVLSLRPGMERDRDEVIHKLIDLHYDRNDMDFHRGTFRVHGDVLEIFPAESDEYAYRVEFFGDEIDRITEIDVLTGKSRCALEHIAVFPASHYVVPMDKILEAAKHIEEELDERVRYFKREDKLIEAQRIAERTNFDIEMLKETGFCSGIENYSRHLSGLEPGATPHTLMDYFPDDFLIIIDESHKTVPQIGAMYAGDQSRKSTLVDYGFRLPSAKDNRPLNFEEFENKIDQILFVSATPGDYEAEHELLRAEQIIRPTGLLDPEVVVRPVEGQIDDLIDEIRERVARHERVLVTTLTKRMAEDLTDHLLDAGIRVNYMHSDTATMDRVEILRSLRQGKIDVLVGINLLREGLDLPEVSLVAILDADKEGFLRNRRSLIQTIGRAARNAEGEVVMYADSITDSMREAIDETNRRRAIQTAYNEEHGIKPQTVRRSINDISSFIAEAEENVGKKDRSRGDTLGHGAFFSPAGAEGEDDAGEGVGERLARDFADLPAEELGRVIETMEDDMRAASEAMDFEEAARLRDIVVQLKAMSEGTSEDEVIEALRKSARKGSVFAPGRKRTGARFKR